MYSIETSSSLVCHYQIEDAHTFWETTSLAERTSLTQDLLPPLALDRVLPCTAFRATSTRSFRSKALTDLTHSALAQYLANLLPLTQDPPRQREDVSRVTLHHRSRGFGSRRARLNRHCVHSP